MAVVNGELKGFEIKSDRDTLGRLEGGLRSYNKVFDTLSIVVGSRHVQRVETMVPSWWGIWVVDRLEGRDALSCIRAESRNEHIDPYALVQLLWREETLALLLRHNLASGLRGKPRRHLWDILASSLTVSDLRNSVRAQLKARQLWRSAELRKARDVRGSYLPPSCEVATRRSPIGTLIDVPVPPTKLDSHVLTARC